MFQVNPLQDSHELENVFVKHYAPNHMLAAKDDSSNNVLVRKGYNSNVLDGQTDKTKPICLFNLSKVGCHKNVLVLPYNVMTESTG